MLQTFNCQNGIYKAQNFEKNIPNLRVLPFTRSNLKGKTDTNTLHLVKEYIK